MQESANNKHSRVRYTLIFAILATIYAIALAIIALPYARRNMENENVYGHLIAYKEMLERDDSISAKSVLFNIDGPVETERKIAAQGRDNLHIMLEAMLLPLNEEEIERGLVSYIPRKTKLLGVTESNGYVFAEFSNNLMFSTDLDKAIEQIELTIKANTNTQDIVIISDGIAIN